MLMKRISTLLLTLALLLIGTNKAWSATITMPWSYNDTTNAEVTVTEKSTLTFPGSYWGEDEMLKPVSVHLVPAAGSVIRIKCTKYYGFGSSSDLKVYNGATTISGYSLPSGDMGTIAENKVFESTASDGSLTVAVYNEDDAVKYAFDVELVSNADMAYSTTSEASIGKTTATLGAGKQVLMGINVQAEGANNPLSLTQLAFSLANTADASILSNLQIYSTKEVASFDISKASLFGVPTTSGTTVTAVGSQALTNGNNYFWLVGEIAPSATLGTEINAECTSLKIGDEEKLAEAISGTTITVGNELLMTTAGIYNVGPSGFQFYDDGGKDDKISSKFEGSVTFKPTTAGKVVQINFTKVGLYQSAYGSDSYDDKLKVYNGSSVSDDNLNAQVYNNQPVILRSSADDGSLTVWLKSVTGDYYRGAGFEATVSEYEPAPMTVTSVETQQVSDQTSAAGSTDQPILAVLVKTENTQAINATKLTFNTEGTTDINHLSKAKVYYTAKSSTFATTNLLATVTPAAEFSVDIDQELVEGDNYFWLTYDIDPRAQTGEILDAGCSQVTVGGSNYTPATVNPDGNSSVENIIKSDVGSVEKTIYGTWTFTNTPNPYASYNGYEPVQGDQITTFVPGNDNTIIELDIQSFALYYSTSTYYPQAKFQVYSGKGTTGELLWALTSADDKNVGPGHILRSKSIDGALTVVFNANTTSSSYTAKGWTAEVREYVQRAMEVNKVVASQASTEVINQGAQNQEILGIDIQTGGNLSAVVLNGITFDMKGSQANVSKLHVYSTGTSSTIAKETSIADLDINAETAEATVTFARPIELAEDHNYFWLTFDINDDATIDATIDAAVKSITTTAATITVDAADGDPEGSRTVKNTYNLQAGDNGEIVVGDSALMFYDNGGADGQTPKNFEGQITFRPKDEGKVVKLTFNNFKISYNDNFSIYYGGEKKTTADKKVSSLPDAPVISLSDDGKITVYFKSPSYSYASDGWEIEATQYELQPLSVGEVKAESVAAAQSLRGAKDVAMLRLGVTVAGDKGKLNFSKFAVSAEGSAANVINAAKVYVTTTTDFSTNNLIGTASESPYDVTADYTVTAPGNYYFWIAYDFNAEANAGDTAQAKVTSITAGCTDVAEGTVTASTAMKAGKKGTYTVGEGGDYATIQAAVNDIATGIEGPVVINIKSGEYNEKVNIPEINGASDINPVTIQSESGDYNDVKIYHNSYTDPGYNIDKYGVVTFNGADYVTLRGVTVTSTDITYPALIYMINVSQHDTVDACHLLMNRVETTSTGEQIVLIRQLAKDVENGNNDYFTLSNSLIEGGYRGAILAGTSYTALTKQVGTVIEGNTFRNNAASAISSYSGDNDMTIRGNVIENTTTTLSRGFTGMDLQFGNGWTVAGNSIHLDLGVEATGIYVRKGVSAAESRSRIVNNEISTNSSETTSSALKINSKTTNVDIAYNTLVVGGATSNVACYLNDEMVDFNVCNNIILARDGGLVYRLYKDSYVSGINFSNNVCHTTGSVFGQTSSTTKYATFGEWATAVNETNSYNEDVAFLSSTMLFPSASGNLLNATPLDYVKEDILGVTRSTANPTIGAYEFTDPTVVPVCEEGYPAISAITHNSAVLTLKTAANGKAYIAVKESSEAAPTAEALKAETGAITLRAGKEVTADLSRLASQTEYVAYVLLESLDGSATGDVVASDAFTTTYLPTEVSTFENVKPTESGFVDGTVEFAGFTVEEMEGTAAEGTKVAKIGEASALQLTNTDKGLTLKGFYYLSDVEVPMNVYDGDGNAQPFTLPATANWIFYNLKDKGLVAAIDFASTGNSYIDDFSGDPQPLAFVCTVNKSTVDSGEKAQLIGEYNGGVYPITVEWTNAMKQAVATGANTETPALTCSGVFTATATDAWGSTAEDATVVFVEGAQAVATFDDNYLAPESYYNGRGADDEDWTSPGTISQFVSGSFAFDTEHHTSTWWSGFGMSNQTSTTFESYADQYKSAVGHGHNSANYGVLYSYSGSTYAIHVSNSADGDDVTGFYVTNTANNANAYVNGDGMSTKAGGFETGDYFLMNVNVTKADNTTATLEYYLADYRSENAADHYYLDTWQWVDLRQFGKIRKVTFSFSGTKTNTWGLTTPTYACIDDFGGSREISDATEVLAGITVPATVDLPTLFTFDDDQAAVTYAITDECDATKATATISEGNLTVTGVADMTETEVVVSATQKGKIQFVRVPVRINEKEASVNDINVSSDVRVFPVPTTDRLNIHTALTDYSICVYASNGALVMQQDGNSGNVVLPVAHLAKGVYILTINNDQQSTTRRFVIK